VPTLAMAWQIVQGAGRRNSGLVFDTWHFVRGKSLLSDLSVIPGDKIHCVQLNDGPLELPAGVTIKDDCYDRKFPGDGQFQRISQSLTHNSHLMQIREIGEIQLRLPKKIIGQRSQLPAA